MYCLAVFSALKRLIRKKEPQMLKLLKNRNFILLLSVGLGLGLPQASVWSEVLMLPALALAMTLATISVPNDYFRRIRAMALPSGAGMLMTYGVLGGAIMVLSALFISDPNIRLGFLLIAVVPPAVAVIPFTAILDGDVSFALAATAAAYLAGLVVMPVFFWAVLDAGAADPVKLFKILFLLIILPILLSRLILFLKLQERIVPVRGVVTDWCFFIVVYTMVGMNQALIFSRPLLVLPVAGVIVAVTFGLGEVIERVGAFFHWDPKKRKGLILLGTLKNQGIAGGLALSLFEKEAALPSAVYSVVMIMYVLWLDWRQRRVRGEG